MNLEKKASLIVLVSLIVIGIFILSYCNHNSESCQHEWSEATCIKPQTCTKCGISKGDALGHSFSKATCTEPETCTKCGLTRGPALGHTTESGICSRCYENLGTWKLSDYVDEFNNPTGEKFISTSVYGVFSNSATTNSSLYAQIQVDTDDVSIILWEYSNHMVKCTYRYDDYSITMLDTNNQKHYLSGTMYNGGFRIYLDDDDKEIVLNALEKSGKISFYLVHSKYTTSTYKFTIETSNFSLLYKKLS